MGKVLVSDDKLTAIGDAIRSKAGTSGAMTLDAMAAAIAAISTGAELPSGVACGELNLTNTSTSTTNLTVITTAQIGFTPTHFMLVFVGSTTTANTMLATTFDAWGTKYSRSTAYLNGSSAVARLNATTAWTTQTNGYLYLSSNTVYYRNYSSYVLRTGRYIWLAIQ